MNNSQDPRRHIHPSLQGLEGFFNLFESSCVITQKNQAGLQTVYEFPTCSLRYNQQENSLFVTGLGKNGWNTIKLTDDTKFCYKRYGRLSSLVNLLSFNKEEISLKDFASITQIKENYDIDIGMAYPKVINNQPVGQPPEPLNITYNDRANEIQQTREETEEVSYGSNDSVPNPLNITFDFDSDDNEEWSGGMVSRTSPRNRNGLIQSNSQPILTSENIQR